MSQHIRKALTAVAVLAAAALGGSAIAGAASKRQTTTTTTTTQSRPSIPQHGTAPHEGAEKPVTGDAADKAKAAAVKYVGSGSTAGDVVTDYTGDGYEVTVTKADGSKVEVRLDKSFNVLTGGRGGRGHFGGPAPGTAAEEANEKAVTGDAADQAKAAAEKSVGSGSTAGTVTNDSRGDGYEVTVTKADGSKIEVHLDKSFNVMQGRGPGGAHFGPDGDQDGPASQPATSTNSST